jgi:hypothetical protein
VLICLIAVGHHSARDWIRSIEQQFTVDHLA